MPDTKLTDEQITWANALARAAGVAEMLVKEDEPTVDQYGIAYQDFDPRVAPGELKNGKMVSPKEWTEVGDELAGERKSFMDDYANKLADVKKGGQTPQQRMAKCLPVLDAPENNPERGKLEKLLGELDTLSKEMAKPLPGGLSREEQKAKKQEFARQKGALLNKMHRDLAEWVNRRTETGQPPPREAVALSDIVQAEHQKLIKDHIDNGWSPPPVGDMDQLTEEEQAEVKAQWDRLLDGSGALQFPISKPTGGSKQERDLWDSVTSDRTEGPPTEQELKQFRIEMLAAMARLMGTPSGRDMFAQMEKAFKDNGKRVQFMVGNSPACWAYDGGSAKSDANPENPEKDKRGAGTDPTITYKLGGKDSYRSYNMDNGNFLFAPTPITLAHEMAHALHNMEGTKRDALPMTGIDPLWNNFEEYWTITKGDLSEQTFRQDYGLSAMRFGHISQDPKSDAANKSIKAVENSKALADLRAGTGSGPVDIETVLQTDRGFTKAQVDMMNDTIKLEIMKDPTVKGPLPAGWDPVRLTGAKIKSIVADNLPFRMYLLGWTAYNLDYTGGATGALGFPESLKDITLARVHHPRSASGRQFKSLGGKTAIDAFPGFKTATGTNLGAWNTADWRANLRTLIQADARVNEMIAKIPFVATADDKGPLDKIVSFFSKLISQPVDEVPPLPSVPLPEKLRRIAVIFAKAVPGTDTATVGPLFVDDALTHFGYTGAAKPDAQLAFLKQKSTALASSDTELRKGGLAVDDLSLVARDKAAKVLGDFKALPAFATFGTNIARATELADTPASLDEAAEAYAKARVEMLTLDGWLAKSTDQAVATAIRKLHIDNAADELARKGAFGDIVDKAMDKNDESAAELFKGTPTIDGILNNSRASDAFSDWLEKTPAGKLLWDAYFMLYMRRIDQIADTTQGNALRDIGFKQGTIVRLARDASDQTALAKALEEAHGLLAARLPEFLKEKNGGG